MIYATGRLPGPMDEPGVEARMDLAELIDGLPVRVIRGDAPGVRVCDVTEDSRTAVPGSLFIARRGAEFDGRRCIEPAIECGTVAVLTDDAQVELPAFSAVALLVTDDVDKFSTASPNVVPVFITWMILTRLVESIALFVVQTESPATDSNEIPPAAASS